MSTPEGLAKRTRDPLETKPQQEDDAYTKAGPKAKHTKGLQSLLIAVSVPLILGSIDGLLFSPNQPFYRDLQKPWWNPPGWLFGLVWSLLYPIMGLASWLVWAEGGWRRQQTALSLYLLQLSLNLLWPYLFFGLHSPVLALVDIIALVLVIGLCIPSFHKANHVAANLLKPYLAWVTFAAALNYSLWMMNRHIAAAVTPDEPLLQANSDPLH